MRIIKTVGLAFMAMLALSAVAATSASAHTWLFPAGTELKEEKLVTSTGELLLTDLAGGPLGEAVSVLCTGKDHGTVGPGPKDKVDSITNLTGGLWASCTTQAGSCGNALAMAVNLPWETELTLVEGVLRDLLKTTNAGWAVKCTVLGITEEDVCTGMTNVGLDNESGGVTALFDATSLKEKANCTRGGTGAGDVMGKDKLELTGLAAS